MRIAFVDLAAWDYSIDAPASVPLGGSQSALCYLAKELARLGHEVTLVNRTTLTGISDGVTYCPVTSVAAAQKLSECDVAILQNAAGPAAEIKALLAPRSRLILWTQHAHDQPAMQPLRAPEVRNAFNGFALVSDWQRRCYLDQFGLDAGRCQVLRNAAGPLFEKLFVDGPAAAAAKAWPPQLAYTSTPFRGLDILLDVFPAIRRAIPGTELQVFSSMQVYQVPAAKDTADYGHLYRRCLEIEGVEYIGSLPQPELALALRSVSMLCYPNHFAETSCIAVMEALAAGLRVVTSDLGALPETAAGCATLVSVDGDWQAYRERFTAAAIRLLESINADPSAAEEHLQRQFAVIQRSGGWQQRAREWSDWLSSMVAS